MLILDNWRLNALLNEELPTSKRRKLKASEKIKQYIQWILPDNWRSFASVITESPMENTKRRSEAPRTKSLPDVKAPFPISIDSNFTALFNLKDVHSKNAFSPICTVSRALQSSNSNLETAVSELSPTWRVRRDLPSRKYRIERLNTFDTKWLCFL